MNIIFDLDGTVIDSRLRLYCLFQHLAPHSSLTFEQYWSLKKEKISNEKILASILNLNSSQIALFVSEWMILIESPAYLALDKNFEGIHEALDSCKKIADLYVCTARQRRAPVIDQLEKLGLLNFFTQVIVTEQKYSKEFLIETHVPNHSSRDWLVGDTGKDVHAGKVLNMRTCGVLSGFLGRKSLEHYGPDQICDSVMSFALLESLT